MVFDFYAHKVSRITQALCKGYVVATRCRVPAGVIVGKDNRRRSLENRRLEYLPRVNYGGRLAPYGRYLVCGDAVAGVEVEDNEKLSVRIPEIIKGIQVDDNIVRTDKSLAAHVLPYLFHFEFYYF